MMQASDKLWAIQALRGVAALMVALMHVAGFASRSGVEASIQFKAFMQNIGHVGVDIFFVISGFIVYKILERENDMVNFAIKRVARIYPLYLVIVLITVIYYYNVGFMAPIRDLLGNLWALTLIKSSSILGVSWTLVFEIHFYLVAALAILFKGQARTALLLWTVAHVAVTILIQQKFLPSYRFFNPIALEFVFGIYVGFLADRFRIPFPKLLIAIGFALPFVANFYFDALPTIGRGYNRPLLWGLPSALMLLGAIEISKRGSGHANVFSYVGDISYSVYMWHWLVATIVYRNFPVKIDTVLEFMLYICITLSFVIVVSHFSFKWLEKPSNAFASSFARKRGKPGIIAA